MTDENDKLQRFIEPGSEIAGSVAGTALGLIAAGPTGAIVGAAVGPVVTRIFKRTCLDIYNRVSGHREKVRGGAAAAYALTTIAARIRRGDSIRDDGFFDSESKRSSADEILEGVILKSRNEHEEKKTRYYANIFSTAAFDARFTAEDLNYALVVAPQLTYRQLCLLQLFSIPQPIPLPDHDYDMPESQLPSKTITVLAEIYGLYQVGLVTRHARHEGDNHYLALLGVDDVNPSQMIRTRIGDRLQQLMQLQTLLFDDLKRVAASIE